MCDYFSPSLSIVSFSPLGTSGILQQTCYRLYRGIIDHLSQLSHDTATSHPLCVASTFAGP